MTANAATADALPRDAVKEPRRERKEALPSAGAGATGAGAAIATDAAGAGAARAGFDAAALGVARGSALGAAAAVSSSSSRSSSTWSPSGITSGIASSMGMGAANERVEDAAGASANEALLRRLLELG